MAFVFSTNAINPSIPLEKNALPLNAKQFLLSLDIGSYTCARVCMHAQADKVRVVQWSLHFNRLWRGWCEIAGLNMSDSDKSIVELSSKCAIQSFCRLVCSTEDVRILVVHFHGDTLAKLVISIYVSNLSAPPFPCVEYPSRLNVVLLQTLVTRSQPLLKLTSWIHQRDAGIPRIEECTAKPVSMYSDVLLGMPYENDVEVLEGFVSNAFFIYNDGTIRTSGNEWVLNGSIRQIIVDQFSDMGTLASYVLSFERVLWSDRSMWVCCFLTSTFI